jgi:hypothetical protein
MFMICSHLPKGKKSFVDRLKGNHSDGASSRATLAPAGLNSGTYN